MSEAAAAVLGLLEAGALTADELSRGAGVDPASLAVSLMELELAGRVMLEDGVYRPTL